MSGYIQYPSQGGGGGGGGITSINGSTTAAQLFIGANGILVSSSGGTTTVSTDPEFSNGTAGSTLTVNWANGPAQSLTTSANITFTFSNGASGQGYVLRITSGGSFTATWPASVKWGSLGAPTLSTTSGLNDLINFYFDGTTYYGSYVLGY